MTPYSTVALASFGGVDDPGMPGRNPNGSRTGQVLDEGPGPYNPRLIGRRQRFIEESGRAHEAQICERLREVPQVPASLIHLFGVETDVIGIGMHLFEEEPRPFDVAAICGRYPCGTMRAY